MKRCILLAFAFGALNSYAQTMYPSGVTSCIARYDFATTQSQITALNDVSGNNNNSSVVQNLTTAAGWRNKPNKSMAFNGTSSYALIPNSSSLTPNAITMVALVKMDDYYSGACQISQILCKGAPGYISGQYSMGFSDNQYDNDCNSYHANNEQLIGYFYNSFNTPGAFPTSGNYVNTNNWFFVAIAYDGSQVKYYQAIMDSNNHLGNLTPIFTNTNVSSSFGASTQDISIGKHLNPPYPYWFNGKMDELTLFNRILTGSEIQSIYDYLWEVFSVSPSFINNTFCQGGTFNLPITVKANNAFQPTNIMTAQISDANGSFASPTSIGTASLFASGNIPCTMPMQLPAGNGYKIRLVSSAPYEISTVFETSITLSPSATPPTVTITANPNTAIAAGQAITFTASSTNAGSTPTYHWLKNGSYISGAISTTYTTNALNNDDVISATVKSSIACAMPDTSRSNSFLVKINAAGINVVNSENNLFIYPNQQMDNS